MIDEACEATVKPVTLKEKEEASALKRGEKPYWINNKKYFSKF